MVGAGTWATCGPWRDEAAKAVVTLDVAQDVAFVPAGEASELWAVVRVAADEGDCDERPPISVALVIDTSGSMEGRPIEAAREAALAVVEALQDGDRLTLVSFDSEARLVVESTEIDGGTREDLRERIEGMEARGTTDLARGLELALRDLERVLEPGVVARLVLLSDGVPNDAGPVIGLAMQAAARGITITAFGFGLDYDATLLGSIAQTTGGSFHSIEDAGEIAPMFRAENARLQGVVARGMSMTLVSGPKVRIEEVVGQGIGLGESAVLGLGDLSRGEERVVAVRLSVEGHREGAAVEVMDVVLSYHDVATGVVGVQASAYVSARASADAGEILASRDREVEVEVAKQKAAAATLQAVAWTRDGDVKEASKVLRQAVPKAAAVAEAYWDEELEARAREMERLAEVLEVEDEVVVDAEERGRWLNVAHGNAMNSFQARKR